MRISLDTNVWIFGIVGADFYCEQILLNLTRFEIIIPDQVREELERNLSDYDMKLFYQFIYQCDVRIDFERVPQTSIKEFEEKGLRKGDVEIGAFCEWRQIDILVSDNRDFLRSLSPDRGFQVMSPKQSGLAACILVFRETKPGDHRRKVFFIDASNEFKKGRAQNELLAEHVDHIHRWHAEYQDVEGIARVVPLDEIRENDYNLNIPRYVEPVIEEETISVEDALDNLKISLQAAYTAEDRLTALLRREGLLDESTNHTHRN